MPEADRPIFGEWTKTLGLAFLSIADAEVRARVEQALADLDAYVGGLIAERRARPGDDMISRLIEVEEGGDRLSPEELVALVENLLFAGHDTTRGALAAMGVLFATHPDQYAAVVADPSLIPGAVDEVIRYEAITFGTARLASEDCELGGAAVPAGMPVSLCLTSACRDPRRYPDPDRFDVRRDDARSPAFGAGIHYCLGAALAKAELEEALSVLTSEVASARAGERGPLGALRRHPLLRAPGRRLPRRRASVSRPRAVVHLVPQPGGASRSNVRPRS